MDKAEKLLPPNAAVLTALPHVEAFLRDDDFAPGLIQSSVGTYKTIAFKRRSRHRPPAIERVVMANGDAILSATEGAFSNLPCLLGHCVSLTEATMAVLWALELLIDPGLRRGKILDRAELSRRWSYGPKDYRWHLCRNGTLVEDARQFVVLEPMLFRALQDSINQPHSRSEP